jgi:hypothetical protein
LGELAVGEAAGDPAVTARLKAALSLGLGTLSAVLFVVALTLPETPLAAGRLSGFLALAGLGLISCATSNAIALGRHGWLSTTYWTNPLGIMGILLGAAAVVLIVLTLVGFADTKSAYVALGVIIFIKVGLQVRHNSLIAGQPDR